MVFRIDRLVLYLDEGLGHPVPRHANPTDHALDLVSTDFISEPSQRTAHAGELAARWATFSNTYSASGYTSIKHERTAGMKELSDSEGVGRRRRSVHDRGLASGVRRGVHQTIVLMERNTLNYSRNLLAYGVRIAMYRKSPSPVFTSPPCNSNISKAWHDVHVVAEADFRYYMLLYPCLLSVKSDI